MKQYFYEVADSITKSLRDNETLLLNLVAEESTFIRFNNSAIRQAGNVKQCTLSLQFIFNQRQSCASTELTGELDRDLNSIQELLDHLREQIHFLAIDPYLHFAKDVINSEQIIAGEIASSDKIVNLVLQQTRDLDMVGIFARGKQYRGFANSYGQRNWFSTENFNLDWSVYNASNKAVKMNYAGTHWKNTKFINKIQQCQTAMDILENDEISLQPGKYRVYLAPSALVEIVDMLCWGGFDLKSHKTAQTPLIKMVTDKQRLHENISISENQTSGIGPTFTAQGFIKPTQVNLIVAGKYNDCLVNARSAKEYHREVNAGSESPSCLDFSAGTIPEAEILTLIDTGIYINNLWYCNYSDRSQCKITGMTRYACYWIENGKIIAPINVMRFDETIYNMLGLNLLGLTTQREFISDASSYDFRSISSNLIPGALIDNFTLTL